VLEGNKEIMNCDKVIIENLNIVADTLAKRLKTKYDDELGKEYFKYKNAPKLVPTVADALPDF